MLRITRSQQGGAGHARRAVVAAARAAAEDVVSHWHGQVMPDHFTAAGGRKYGYQPRSGDLEPPRILVTKLAPSGQTYQSLRSNPHYSWRKRREKRHNKPLVWSGSSAAAAKLGVSVSSRVRRADGEVRAVAAMPYLASYFYMYRKDLGQPDKADELTRVSADEVPALEGVYAASFDRRLAGAADPSAPTVEVLG